MWNELHRPGSISCRTSCVRNDTRQNPCKVSYFHKTKHRFTMLDTVPLGLQSQPSNSEFRPAWACGTATCRTVIRSSCSSNFCWVEMQLKCIWFFCWSSLQMAGQSLASSPVQWRSCQQFHQIEVSWSILSWQCRIFLTLFDCMVFISCARSPTQAVETLWSQGRNRHSWWIAVCQALSQHFFTMARALVSGTAWNGLEHPRILRNRRESQRTGQIDLALNLR